MSTHWIPNRYPKARRSDHVDTYQSATSGTVSVSDPYQWLEEDSTETEEWISEQRDFTRAYLDLYPDRRRLESTLRASADYANFNSPTLYDDNRWYWTYNSGLQPQSVMYRSLDNILPHFKPNDDTEPGDIFFDPNVLSEGGTVSLTHFEISRSGELLGYGLSQSGSDEIILYIRPTSAPLTQKDDTGRLPDEIKFVKFSDLSWAPDSEGFFYQRFPEADSTATGTQTSADSNAMICYHRVMTNQAEDIVIHEDADHPAWMFSTTVTEDGDYLILQTFQNDGQKNLVWIVNFNDVVLGKPIPWIKLCDSFDAEYSYVTNDGSVFYFRTNKDDSPQYKLISVDISAETPVFTVVIPEQKGVLLRAVQRVNSDRFVVRLKRNAKDELYIYDNNGKEQERLFPDFIGTMIASCRDFDSWLFITMRSFTVPGTIAYYDFKNPDGQRLAPFRQIVVKSIDLENFETTQVWFHSKDGTPVPMFLTRHKSAPFDGTAPGVQFGYGGFGISVDPFFSPTHLTFIKIYGGVFAVVIVRGGGELGEDWHQAGARENKKNSFDDFIAATEFLVEHEYVAPGKVALNGGSNGGLLVVASINRAPPGTFGVGVAEVPVLDMLRFNKFTSGKSWVSDYGNPDDPNDFDFIYPISPLHNIPDQVLPPIILSTADHDDRVVPMHSFKHAATLQYTRPFNPYPFLLRVDKDAGHGQGKSIEQRLQQDVDQWGFAAQTMGLIWKEE